MIICTVTRDNVNITRAKISTKIQIMNFAAFCNHFNADFPASYLLIFKENRWIKGRIRTTKKIYTLIISVRNPREKSILSPQKNTQSMQLKHQRKRKDRERERATEKRRTKRRTKLRYGE